MIPFNVPLYVGNEEKYINLSIKNRRISGNGEFTKKCEQWFKESFSCKKVLLTTSGTHALEMAAMLAEIKDGDEVIMSSYTFSSTANAFVLRGAKIVFVDIRPDTMNIDEKLIERAVTSKTRAIVVVHYAGISCEMDAILKVAKRCNLLVVEDAAQGMMSKYKDKFLGTISDIGCYSFHETKNYTCGEGGAIVLNDEKFFERAEIIWEKGTDRSKFFRGQVDKYRWTDIGSSYLLSELNAAYLYAQLEMAEKINRDRVKSWDLYYRRLNVLAKKGFLELPSIPETCEHNAHMFYIKANNLDERIRLVEYLKRNEIMAIFHYVPLHLSPAGSRFGRFDGEDNFTTKEGELIVRLPMYYGLKESDIEKITETIEKFYVN